MRLYIFRSEASNGLRAFVGDAAGRNLSPRTKLIWQIATGHVSGESSQTGFCI